MTKTDWVVLFLLVAILGLFLGAAIAGHPTGVR